MVRLEIEFIIHPGKRTEFLQLMDWFAGDKRPGKVVYEQIGAPNRFLWVERWSTMAALHDHCRSKRHKTVLGAMGVLGRVVSVNTVAYSGEHTTVADGTR